MHMLLNMCMCVRVRIYVCACARICVCLCVYVCVYDSLSVSAQYFVKDVGVYRSHVY